MNRGIAAVVALTGVLISAPIQASVLYSAGISQSFYTVSQTTGAATKIGTTTFATTDLASDTRPGSFRIWGNINTGVGATGQLVSINPATGAGTVVGNFNTPNSITGLAFDIVSGKLYGMENDWKLYEINTQTGAGTLVGNAGTGLLGSIPFGADLSGNLFTVDQASAKIYQIDKQTAAATLVTTLSSDMHMSDLAFRPEDGQLFAITDGSGTSQTAKSAYTIDLVHGTATRLGPTSSNETSMNGMAFGAGTFVPEPTFLGMMALTSTLFTRRRVRK